ncbi:ficolin-2-like isoform X1 [Mytilus galloprovincialis]|uniref:ficolin-2-like isoform X1 n=1 Tax=Mytilus galloprovincialis TaxID=29158 RepID=UPI003F7BBFB0
MFLFEQKMRAKTVSLLLTFFLKLTTLNFVRTIPLNNSDDAVVEMPLVTNNLKAPLVADLDVSALNKQLKHYIDTAISKTFTGKVKDIVKHSQDELKTTMLLTYKERLQESKAVYENLAHLVGGFKSRLENVFSDLKENVTDLIDNLEEWKKDYTQTISEKYRPIDVPRDCTDIKENNMKSGVYTIFLADNVNDIKVYCDMDVDGGGWIVIQRRSERKVKFERTWNEYENGFGEVAGEHWLGNKYIHSLTNNGKFELRLNMETKDGEDIYALYKSFILGDAASQYQLTVNDYSGTAGDALQRQSSGNFSAIDRDNDRGHNYAVEYGPWWYTGGSNTWLNDDQRDNYWGKHDYIGRKTTMMIRRL